MIRLKKTKLKLNLKTFIPVTTVINPMYLSPFHFTPRVMYNLEDGETPGIAINLLPILARDMQNKGEHSQTKKAHKSVTLLPPPLTSSNE